MQLEARLAQVIGPLLSGKFYPDTSPDTLVFPFGIYQQVGGPSLWFLENVVADARGARMQIEVWSRTRLEAAALSRQIEQAMAAANWLACRPEGAAVALYEEQQKIYGARQDFTIWHNESV